MKVCLAVTKISCILISFILRHPTFQVFAGTLHAHPVPQSSISQFAALLQRDLDTRVGTFDAIRPG